jgi:hypothetical protein
MFIKKDCFWIRAISRYHSAFKEDGNEKQMTEQSLEKFEWDTPPWGEPNSSTKTTAKAYGQFDGTDLPDRYAIRTKDEERVLVCTESPTISVHVERGLAVSPGAALKAPAGTIYLDGAAQGGPFLNNEKSLLNLDHHEGCLRAFTVATCEQAMIVVRKGLDLQKRDWAIWANEPDLDTVLAIWILLNHMRLNDPDPEIRSRLMPFVRLEGAIDAHGLEMQELCGFPPEIQASVFRNLERLRSREVELKKEGKWQDIDFLEYTADVLRAADAMIYILAPLRRGCGS